MDTESYEQFVLTAEQLGEAVGYIVDGMTLDRTTYQGETIGVELPISVEMLVTHTEPGFAGDTQSGARKPATMPTGLVVQVPDLRERGRHHPRRHAHRRIPDARLARAPGPRGRHDAWRRPAPR